MVHAIKNCFDWEKHISLSMMYCSLSFVVSFQGSFFNDNGPQAAVILLKKTNIHYTKYNIGNISILFLWIVTDVLIHSFEITRAKPFVIILVYQIIYSVFWFVVCRYMNCCHYFIFLYKLKFFSGHWKTLKRLVLISGFLVLLHWNPIFLRKFRPTVSNLTSPSDSRHPFGRKLCCRWRR